MMLSSRVLTEATLLLGLLLSVVSIDAFVATPQGFQPHTTAAYSASSSSGTILHAYKKVFVAGGSRGVGRLVVDKLVAQGKEVVAMVRTEEAMKEAIIHGRSGVTQAEVSSALAERMSMRPPRTRLATSA